MGNFFTSPYETASKNMYDMALSGKTPWDDLLTKQSAIQKTGIDRAASQNIATQSGDILSQLTSMGIAPGSGIADIIAKSGTGIRSSAQTAKSSVDASALERQFRSLIEMLQGGRAGLSKSSPFGDIMAALQTGGNIFEGVARGGGKEGLNFWG